MSRKIDFKIVKATEEQRIYLRDGAIELTVLGLLAILVALLALPLFSNIPERDQVPLRSDYPFAD